VSSERSGAVPLPLLIMFAPWVSKQPIAWKGRAGSRCVGLRVGVSRAFCPPALARLLTAALISFNMNMVHSRPALLAAAIVTIPVLISADHPGGSPLPTAAALSCCSP